MLMMMLVTIASVFVMFMLMTMASMFVVLVLTALFVSVFVMMMCHNLYLNYYLMIELQTDTVLMVHGCKGIAKVLQPSCKRPSIAILCNSIAKLELFKRPHSVKAIFSSGDKAAVTT